MLFLSHTLKDNIAAAKHESWYFSSEPIQTQIEKEKKDVKTVHGKVVVSDNSLTGSFCVVSILIQLNLNLLETPRGIPLTSKEKHSQTLHDDEGGDKPHHLPTDRDLRIFFPPETAAICQFPC